MTRFYSKVRVREWCWNTYPWILLLIIFIIFNVEDFHKRGEEERLIFTNKMTSLRIVYQNLGLGSEVRRKYTDVLQLMTTRSPHVMFISETLIDTDSWTKIEGLGYTIETMPRRSERIWAAVKDSVIYSRATEYEIDNFPAIWLRVGQGKGSYLICGLYREFTRPTEKAKESRRLRVQRLRWQQFLEQANKAAMTNSEIHIVGDMNIDYARWIQNGNGIPGWRYSGLVEDLHDQLMNHGFVQTVDQITRVSGDGKQKSILDLHLTNKPLCVKSVLVTGDVKSDHMAITVTRKPADQIPDPIVEGRSWSKVDWWELKDRIQREHLGTLQEISRIRNVNEQTVKFTEWAGQLLDVKTPVKRRVFRSRYNPWMNSDLLKKIREKSRLLKLWQRNRLQAHLDRWLVLKKEVSKECRQASHAWWEEKLRDGVPSEKLWVSARQLIGEKTPGAPSQIVVDNQLISDPEEVANKCNDKLLGKVDDLISGIPATNKSALDYTREYVASKNFCTFEMPKCDLMRGVGYGEVKAAIKGLKYTDAVSHDHISTRFVKMLKKPLLHIFTQICNRSFEQRTFPEIWKMARVCLLCKDLKQKTNPLKYRPVSILPGPSKVLEKVVVDRLVSFMESNKFFPDQQHGYRSNRSCQTAVLTLQDEILRDMERGVDSAVVFCDLSAAFDTLDHEDILGKMKIYGFTEGSVEWYRSYLTNRSQYVVVGGCKSCKRTVCKGCPQGSLSGPQLFSLVFGDIVIVQLSNGVFMVIYADDLTIKFKLLGNVKVDEALINKQMAAIQQWMNSNKLVFNSSKTELLVISNNKHKIYKELKLTMDGVVVHQKNAVRMLGLYLTYNMRQEYYISQMKNNLVSFLNYRLKILQQLRNKCGDKQFKLLATGLLTSKIVFGINFYGQTTEIQRDKVRMIMNRMVRMSTNTSLAERKRTKDLYKSLEWLTWDSLLATQDLNLLWKLIVYHTPQHLSDHLTEERNQRARSGMQTRASSNPVRVPLTRNNQGTYKYRADAFMSRALRTADGLRKDIKDELDFTYDIKKRKTILKKHYLELDYGGC